MQKLFNENILLIEKKLDVKGIPDNFINPKSIYLEGNKEEIIKLVHFITFYNSKVVRTCIWCCFIELG